MTKTTKENSAFIVIPKSHLWRPDRCPLDEEAIPDELEVGDAMIFVGIVWCQRLDNRCSISRQDGFDQLRCDLWTAGRSRAMSLPASARYEQY